MSNVGRVGRRSAPPTVNRRPGPGREGITPCRPLPATRSPAVTATALLAAAGLCTLVNVGPVARADDKMMADDHSKMATDEADKMKMMAADPAQAPAMTADMAKMMVMDNMAKKMAMDPAMQDPAVMKIYADAKMMAEDPAQKQKMEREIMADPMAIKMVMHDAMKMTMMHDGKMMGGPSMDGGMKKMDH